MTVQSEARFTMPSRAVPHPERWHSTDPDSAEIEVSALVGALVRAVAPTWVVETGTAFGNTALDIGYALVRGGNEGRCVSYETEDDRAAYSQRRMEREKLPVEVVHGSSLDGLATWPTDMKVGFAWLDSSFEIRASELRLLPRILSLGAVVGVHDAGHPQHGKYPSFASEIEHTGRALGFWPMPLATPRGLTLMTWWPQS